MTTITATPYVVPDTALGDLPYEKTDAEYVDMNRVRIGHANEPQSIKVLRAHEQMVRDARDAILDAELALNVATRKVASTGEHDAHLFRGLTVRDLGGVDQHYDISRLDAIRLPALLNEQSERCRDEHRNHVSPWCPSCRRAPEYAEASLRYAMALKPGFTPPEFDDTWSAEPEQDDPYAYGALLDDAALGAMPAPEWLITDLIPKASTGILAGRDRSWKSFMALDLGLQVVLDGGRVLYCIGEGANGFGARRDAWLAHHGLTVDNLGGRMAYLNGVPNLFRRDDVYTRMIETAEREKYDLIIVDTYARAARGSNLNDGGDQAQVTASIDNLRRVCEGTVLAIAHTQKADGDTTGHSEIEDARDFVLHMRREGDAAVLKVAKMKNFDEGDARRLAPLQVGESIVLVDAAEAPEPTEGSHTVRNRVLVALASVHLHGFVPASTIRAVMADDGTGLTVHSGSVYRELNKLLHDGVIDKQTSNKSYRLVTGNETAEKYLKETR